MAAPDAKKKLDTATLWRAALLQLVAVAVLSIVLAAALPKDFFVDWGWIAGPGAWMLCAAFTASVLRLPLTPALIGAVLAVGLFALWCARLPRASVHRA